MEKSWKFFFCLKMTIGTDDDDDDADDNNKERNEIRNKESE